MSSLVVVVDDDALVLASLSALLRATGWSVRTFASAEDFLGAHVLPECGCLLLDIRLPGMSGLELQEKLLGDAIDLPVILISGHADSRTVKAGQDNGALAVLQKPFDSSELIKLIRAALARVQG